jgi:2-iminobutanoate/2-iminopropanoate deaminase
MLRAIQTTSAPQPRGYYSQGVRVGNLLFVSGQLPVDRDGTVVKDTLAQEAIQVLENIRAIVEAAQGSLADIVQCTIYISDLTYWSEVNEIYGGFFADVPVLPARAVVPVKEMSRGARIEIQAVAFLSNP